MSKSFHYDPKKKGHLYTLLIPGGRALAKFLFRIRVVGMENIPEDGGFILAANHVCALDPMFLTGFCPRIVHYMGKSSLFKNPFSRFFLTQLNGFPVHRERLDTKAIHYAEELLRQGDALGIFPEGTRSKTRKPQKAKGGVALIAKATHANVVPVSIYIAEKPRFRTQITVRVGEVIPYEALGLTDEERNTQQLRDAAAIIMERIVELWERKHEA